MEKTNGPAHPTKSVKLNGYISQVTFPHLQVSREKETQTSLFVSYFRFYILAISYDACLSLWFTSLSMKISRSIHVAANGIDSLFL